MKPQFSNFGKIWLFNKVKIKKFRLMMIIRWRFILFSFNCYAYNLCSLKTYNSLSFRFHGSQLTLFSLTARNSLSQLSTLSVLSVCSKLIAFFFICIKIRHSCTHTHKRIHTFNIVNARPGGLPINFPAPGLTFSTVHGTPFGTSGYHC